MSDDGDHDADEHEAGEHDAEEHGGGEDGPPADGPATERTTAPQSPYTGRDVAVGAVIALVGAALVFGVPLLLLA